MSDLVINVRQISNYPPKSQSDGTETLLLQTGGLGGPYQSISTEALVQTALQYSSIGIGNSVPVQASAGQVFSDAFVTPLRGWIGVNFVDDANQGSYWTNGPAAQIGFSIDQPQGITVAMWPPGNAGQPVDPARQVTTFALSPQGDLTLPNGTLTVARNPGLPMEVATASYVGATTVASFNGRRGTVTLNPQDVNQALGVYPPDYIATNATVEQRLQEVLTGHPFVWSFNARVGNIWLTTQDVAKAFFEPDCAPITPTPSVQSNDYSIANTAWVTNLVYNQLWPQLYARYAPIDSPAFTGIPTAPTAALGTDTDQLATTAFVLSTVESGVAGVATFNGRGGNVTLIPADVAAAQGLLTTGGTLTGQLTIAIPAPTGPAGLNITGTQPFVAIGDNQGSTGTAMLSLGSATDDIIYFNSNLNKRWELRFDPLGMTGGNGANPFSLIARPTSGINPYFVALSFDNATGLGVVAGDPTAPNGISTKQYVDNSLTNSLSGYLPLTGGTIDGGVPGTSGPQLQIIAPGVVTPQPILTDTLLRLQNADAHPTRISIDAFGANAAINFRKANGTAAAPVALTSAAVIGAINYAGHDGTSFFTQGSFNCTAEGAWTPTSHGTRFSWGVTPNGSITQNNTSTMILTSLGHLLLGSGTDNATDMLQVSGSGLFTGPVKTPTVTILAGGVPTYAIADDANFLTIGKATASGALDTANEWLYFSRSDGQASFNTPLNLLSTLYVQGSSIFTSTVTLAADPTVALGAATKQYVDSKAGGQWTAGVVSSITANLKITTGVLDVQQLVRPNAAAGSGGTGSPVAITSGTGDGAGTGGAINLSAGSGGASGVGGAINLYAGQGSSTGAGGAIQIGGGTGNGAIAGGAVTLSGGQNLGNGAGGAVTLQGGPGYGTGPSGTVSILGGDNSGFGSGAGGSVLIQPGNSYTAGLASGNVTISAPTPTGGTNGNLIFDSTNFRSFQMKGLPAADPGITNAVWASNGTLQMSGTVPASGLTQTQGDARYLQKSGGMMTGNLDIQNNQNLRWQDATSAFMTMTMVGNNWNWSFADQNSTMQTRLQIATRTGGPNFGFTFSAPVNMNGPFIVAPAAPITPVNTGTSVSIAGGPATGVGTAGTVTLTAGAGATSGGGAAGNIQFALQAQNTKGITNGNLLISNLPTADPGVNGAIWRDAANGNVLKASTATNP